MVSSFAHPSPFTFLRLYFSLKEQIETKNCIPCCSGNSSRVQRALSPPVQLLNRTSGSTPPPASAVMPAVHSGLRWLPAHQAQKGLWPFQLPFPELLVPAVLLLTSKISWKIIPWANKTAAEKKFAAFYLVIKTFMHVSMALSLMLRDMNPRACVSCLLFSFRAMHDWAQLPHLLSCLAAAVGAN